VAGDVKYKGLAEDAEPAFYSVIAQNPSWSNFLVIKTETIDPTTLTTAVRNQIRMLDPDMPVDQIKTLQQHLYTQVAQPRFRTTLITVFALIALILASIGIYGVISYTVSHRTREIGIRMALGAQRRQVLNMIIGQGFQLTAISIALGLIGAFALTRLMKGFLFGVTATDPMTYIAVTTLLMAIAMLACFIPARRATKVDPVIALRSE
jgi:putative ABC transport system permease protein